MRRPALVLLGVLALPRAAAADDYSIHVLGNAQTAWTDNLFSAPEDDDPATNPPESDLYTQIRPGLLVSYETPRTIHQLGYDLEANLYASHTEAWSLSHLASWHGFFITSPRTEVQSSATFSTGTLNSLSTRQPASMTAPDATEGGTGENSFWSLDAGEGLSFGVSRDLRLTQGARARRFSTTDATDTASGGLELGLNVGADRGWSRSAIAVQVSGAYVTLERGGESTDTVNGNVTLSYRRDVSVRWTALIDGGVAAVIPIDGEVFVQPTVGTNIGYTPNWGAAGLQLRRSMAANFYIAQNTITDSATINASLPLPWLRVDPNVPTLTTAAAAGVSRTQQIIGDSLEGATVVGNLDLALQYNPRAGLGFAIRAQHLRQVAEDVPTMSEATRTVDYDRTTVMISATWRFPDRLAAEMPLRDSLRVDRSDNTPVGEEVAPSVAP